MSFIWAFGNIESKHTLYREEDCMKTFCNSLREHATNCNWFWKKENICGKRFLKKFANGKNYGKVRDHCHFTDKFRGTLYSICN